MYFADIALSPFYCGWDWRTGWARISIAGSENEGKIEIGDASILGNIAKIQQSLRFGRDDELS
jgi:hypothetical protein